MLMKPQSTMNPSDDDEGTPVSVKIRERLSAARKRFHANDNISDFIEPGELDRLLDEERPQHRRHGAPRRQDVPQ
jgi:GTP cyclohydrolase I